MNAQPAASARVEESSTSSSEDSGQDGLAGALTRLKHAADALEVAVRRRETARTSAEALEQELQVLFEDRSRLAHELDQVKSRAARLDAASAEVSSRLGLVIANLGGTVKENQ